MELDMARVSKTLASRGIDDDGPVNPKEMIRKLLFQVTQTLIDEVFLP